MKINPSKFALIALALGFPLSLGQAQDVIWGGSDGNYSTGANWLGGSVPASESGTEDPVINSGDVTLADDYFLGVNNTNVLTINGGSLTRSATGRDSSFENGTLEVHGGSFNQIAGADRIYSNSATNWILTNGSVDITFGHQTLVNGAFDISNGTFNASTTAFIAARDSAMSGGTLNIRNFGLNDGVDILFSAGDITLFGANEYNGWGFAQGTASYLDFALGSTGSLFVNSITQAQAANQYFVNNTAIRYNGTSVGGDYATYFNITEGGGGVYITAIPEPSTVAFLAFMGVGLLTLSARRRAVSRM